MPSPFGVCPSPLLSLSVSSTICLSLESLYFDQGRGRDESAGIQLNGHLVELITHLDVNICGGLLFPVAPVTFYDNILSQC